MPQPSARGTNFAMGQAQASMSVHTQEKPSKQGYSTILLARTLGGSPLDATFPSPPRKGTKGDRIGIDGSALLQRLRQKALTSKNGACSLFKLV